MTRWMRSPASDSRRGRISGMAPATDASYNRWTPVLEVMALASVESSWTGAPPTLPHPRTPTLTGVVVMQAKLPPGPLGPGEVQGPPRRLVPHLVESGSRRHGLLARITTKRGTGRSPTGLEAPGPQ